MADKKITIRIAARDRASATIRRVGDTARRIGPRIRRHLAGAFRSVTIAVTALTAAAGGLIKTIIDVGSQTEQARIRLDSIFGSLERGEQAFEAVRKVAAQLPFTFDQVMQGATMMSVAVKERGDDMETRLKQVAEIAARFGIPFREAASQFQRFALSGAAAADMFRERGVNAFLGLRKGVDMSAEASIAAWDRAFAEIEAEGSSAVDRLAGSFAGQVSMLQDALRDLRQTIANSGLLDLAKSVVGSITEAVKLLTEAARTDLGLAVEAAFGYMGAKAGEAFLRAFAKPAEMVWDAIIGDNKFGQWLQDRLADLNAFNIAADLAKKSADEWLDALNILAKRDVLGPVQLPPAPGGTTRTTGSVGGGGVRARIPGGGLQSTIGGPSLPISEIVQQGLTDLELSRPVIQRKWREVVAPDAEDVKRESRTALENAFADVFDNFGKHVGMVGVSVGEDLVTGIIQGTLDAGEILKRALIGFAARFILGPLSSSLGIFSPSKITYGYGQNIVLGMVGGMESMTGALSASAGRVADAALGGLQPVGVGGLGEVSSSAPTLQLEMPSGVDAHPFAPAMMDWFSDMNVRVKYAGG